MQKKTTFERLTKLITEDSDHLRNQLTYAGMQILLVEHIRNWMKERLSGYLGHATGVDDNGDITYSIPDEYKAMFKRNGTTPPYDKHAEWFHEFDAITEDDLTLLIEMRRRRNELGHELVSVITRDDRQEVIWDECMALAMILAKMDNWWFREIEYTTAILPRDQTLDEQTLDTTVSIGTQILVRFVDQIQPPSH